MRCSRKHRSWHGPPDPRRGRFPKHVQPRGGGTHRTELTDDERSALARAAETGRALLLDDPDISLLAREIALSAELLDRLADARILTGIQPGAPGVPSGWRRDASAQS